MIADLLMARQTLGSTTASDREWHRDPIARLTSAHLRPKHLHHASELVPGHMRQPDVRIMPHPTVPIAATNAIRFDSNDHAIAGRDRVRNLLDGQRSGELLVDHRLHRRGNTLRMKVDTSIAHSRSASANSRRRAPPFRNAS